MTHDKTVISIPQTRLSNYRCQWGFRFYRSQRAGGTERVGQGTHPRENLGQVSSYRRAKEDSRSDQEVSGKWRTERITRREPSLPSNAMEGKAGGY